MLTPRPGNSLGAWRAAHVFLPSHAPRPRLPTSPDQSTLCVRCIHVVGLQQQRRAPRHPRSAVSSPSARLSARHLVEPSGCTLLGAALLADATVARACAAPTKLPLRPHASAPRHELGRCHLGRDAITQVCRPTARRGRGGAGYCGEHSSIATMDAAQRSTQAEMPVSTGGAHARPPQRAKVG